jgi:transposase-like protein
MPLHEPLKASASDDTPPRCPTCRTNEHIRRVQLHDVSPGVQYWRCNACQVLWATDEQGDKSIFSV